MTPVKFAFVVTLVTQFVGAVSANGSCGPGSPCVSTIKHYTAGLGSCGISHDGQTAYIVGMSHLLMGEISNGNPNCGMPIRVCIGAKCIDATIEDKCMGCDADTWDVSEALFRDLVGDLDIGKATVNYYLGAPVAATLVSTLVSSSTPSATSTMIISISSAAATTSLITSSAILTANKSTTSTTSTMSSVSNTTAITLAITQTSIISSSKLVFTRPVVTGSPNITAAPFTNSTAGTPFRNASLPSMGAVPIPFAFSGACGVPRPASIAALAIAILGGVASLML